MKEIDARGILCPRPVIMTKKAISDENLEEVRILVDNEIATENLSKMAKQLGFKSSVDKKEKNLYEVYLIKSIELEKTGEKSSYRDICECESSDYIVAIDSDQMGNGDEDFSKQLLEGFIYALKEQDILPKCVIMYNKGVRLATINEKTISDLKEMENKGVEILSCGLCLSNYHLTEKLSVGSATNMYHILEMLRKFRVVKP